jgi:hypothetical protein
LTLEAVKQIIRAAKKESTGPNKKSKNLHIEDKSLFSFEEYTVKKHDSLIGIAIEFEVK